MHVDMNWVVVVGVLAVALVIFIMVRNRKDRKRFEESLGDTEVQPEQHDEDKL